MRKVTALLGFWMCLGMPCTVTAQDNDKALKTADCIQICGEGFVYDRPGAKLNGREKVCTRYPKPCGYACTVDWQIDYLVNNTEYTCQTAVQH